jgi:hypothetical protein
MTPTANVILPSPIGPVEALLPKLSCELPNGATGYYQRQHDDCLRAALATVLQVPYEEVPDFRGDGPGTHADELACEEAQWEWARSLGLRLRIANRPPKGVDTFLAVSPAGEDRFRHVLAVVAGHVFDPGGGFILPPGFEPEVVKVEYIEFFEPREEH